MMLGFCVGYNDRGTRHRACSGTWGRSCPFYRSTQVAARPPPVSPRPAIMRTPSSSSWACLTAWSSMATLYHKSSVQDTACRQKQTTKTWFGDFSQVGAAFIIYQPSGKSEELKFSSQVHLDFTWLRGFADFKIQIWVPSPPQMLYDKKESVTVERAMTASLHITSN